MAYWASPCPSKDERGEEPGLEMGEGFEDGFDEVSSYVGGGTKPALRGLVPGEVREVVP